MEYRVVYLTYLYLLSMEVGVGSWELGKEQAVGDPTFPNLITHCVMFEICEART